jgi:hypothetical protein
MTPTNLPEMLFYHIKQCQEIQCIRKLPYSDGRIIANAICILFQANIFPLKEFDTWEASATKTYPALKTFFHKAYRQRLTTMALCTHQGKMGTPPRTCTMCWKAKTTPTRIWSPPSHRQQSLQPHQALPLRLGWPSMQTSPLQSPSWQQTKWPSCPRWRQGHSHRPRLNTLASMCHATCSKCRPSSRWPYPCSNTFRRVT